VDFNQSATEIESDGGNLQSSKLKRFKLESGDFSQAQLLDRKQSSGEMTDMDTARVEQDLKDRIKQSREWLLSCPPPITNIKYRDRTFTALPEAFLDDPGRVERHGVAFMFSLDDQSRNIKVLLKIRIKPEAKITEKGDSSPYVVVYMANPTTGADEEMSHQDIVVPASYQDMVELSIEEWYRRWIDHALSSNGGKIFKRKMVIHD
jgi:hypothetical protein